MGKRQRFVSWRGTSFGLSKDNASKLISNHGHCNLNETDVYMRIRVIYIINIIFIIHI